MKGRREEEGKGMEEKEEEGQTYRRLISSIHRYSNQSWRHNERSYPEYSDRPEREILNDRLHACAFTKHYTYLSDRERKDREEIE